MAPKKIKLMLNSEWYLAGQVTRYPHSKKWGILLALENTSWNMDEIEMLEDLIFQAKSCLNTELDAKAEYFIKKYEELRTLKNDPDLKVIIFTEFRSTQSMLKKILEERGYRCSDLNSQLLNQR